MRLTGSPQATNSPYTHNWCRDPTHRVARGYQLTLHSQLARGCDSPSRHGLPTHLTLTTGAGVRLQHPGVAVPVHGAHVHAGVPGAVAAPGLQQEGVGAGVGLHAARAAVPGLLHRVLTRQLGAVQRPAVRLPVLTDRTDNTSQSEQQTPSTGLRHPSINHCRV